MGFYKKANFWIGAGLGASSGAGFNALGRAISGEEIDRDSLLRSALVGAGVGGFLGWRNKAAITRDKKVGGTSEFPPNAYIKRAIVLPAGGETLFLAKRRLLDDEKNEKTGFYPKTKN